MHLKIESLKKTLIGKDFDIYHMLYNGFGVLICVTRIICFVIYYLCEGTSKLWLCQGEKELLGYDKYSRTIKYTSKILNIY